MGEDAPLEQLDWGSIDDKDGAFGQLSEVSKIQDLDLVTAEAQATSVVQCPTAGELDGTMGAAAAITATIATPRPYWVAFMMLISLL